MKQPENKAIECTVTQCAHHCDMSNYCSLNKIKVGSHECIPGAEQHIDCLSYVCK